MNKLIVALLFAMILDSNSVKASTIPPFPDISGWTVVQTSFIEMRISDLAVAYLGLDMEYQNPSNPTEYVRVVKRHVPLIFVKKEQQDKRLLRSVVTDFYTRKDEEDQLAKLANKSDPIFYIQWRIKQDLQTRNNIQDGDVNIWFLESSGNWFFYQNKVLSVQFLSESIGNGKQRNVFVGRKYQVSGLHHTLKINRSDLTQFLEEDR